MVQRSNPPDHGHGSAIVLSPLPHTLWCGGGVVLSPSLPCGVVGGVWCRVCGAAGGCSVCMTIYIYIAWWVW